MNVEAYRKTIRRRLWIMTIVGILYVAAMCAVHGLWAGKTTYTMDFLNGAISSVVVYFIMVIPKYRKALRDEQMLRRLWNQEHDERMQAIRARAGAPTLIYTSMAMIAAALLAAPYNMTIAMTLLIAATAQLLISAIIKLTCMRTM